MCAGVDDKLLTVILEFTDVCISTCNIPQARKLLAESEQILQQVLFFLDKFLNLQKSFFLNF